MNPRQRRGVLLIVTSLVAAVGVFMALTAYVGEVAAQVGPMTQAVRLSAAVRAHTPITDGMVEIVGVPSRWRPATALATPREALGRVSPTDLPAGTVLQQGMLRSRSPIAAGLREFAILVDAETGVAGRIDVGSVVDIVATRRGDGTTPSTAEVVIQGAEIRSIGTPATGEAVIGGDFVSGQRVPITFALPPSDILRLAWVESFAETVRLALRSPLDPSTLSSEGRTYVPDGGLG